MRKFLWIFLVIFTFNSLKSEGNQIDKVTKKELYKFMLNNSFNNIKKRK